MTGILESFQNVQTILGVVAAFGGLLWAVLSFFAHRGPTEKKFDEHDERLKQMEDVVDEIRESLAFIRGRIEKQRH